MKLTPMSALVGVLCSVFVHTGWALDDGDGTSVTCDHFNAYGNPYFGDTHVHTRFSVDAFTQGVETTPEQAYRFATGEQTGLHPVDENELPTRFVQIDRPLDFAMVSDHAEFFGEYSICTDPSNPLYDLEPNCVLLRQRDADALVGWKFLLSDSGAGVQRFDFCGPDGSICTDEVDTIWQRMQVAADQFYDRSSDCEFTTFVGYEWTGAPRGTNEQGQLEVRNLHRNDALTRNSFEPLIEVIQHKGQSECLPMVTDELCDYEFIPGDTWQEISLPLRSPKLKVQYAIR